MAMKKSDFQMFDPEEADAIERKIDKTLEVPGTRNLTFSTVGWSAGLKAEIERRYTAAGWTVEFHGDQRDGDFMWLK
jgi:hypothetical protein